MYDYRAELAEINARCDALGITGGKKYAVKYRK